MFRLIKFCDISGMEPSNPDKWIVQTATMITIFTPRARKLFEAKELTAERKFLG